MKELRVWMGNKDEEMWYADLYEDGEFKERLMEET